MERRMLRDIWEDINAGKVIAHVPYYGNRFRILSVKKSHMKGRFIVKVLKQGWEHRYQNIWLYDTDEVLVEDE